MAFNTILEMDGSDAKITLSGELDASVAEQFKTVGESHGAGSTQCESS